MTDENLLNYARIHLRHALADTSGKTKGQLQAFSENPLADKDRSPRRKVHAIEFEDGRRVATENSSVYVLETRSRRRPMPPINDYEFAASPWRRAVNSLPPHQQAWLRYCYGFDLDFRYQMSICEAVWGEMKTTLPRGLLRKTERRLVSLVWLAVQDVAATHFNDTYREYAGSALSRQLGVSGSTWYEVYAPHWRALKCLVASLDEAALTSVLSNMPSPVF